MIVAMVCEVGICMNSQDLMGICLSDEYKNDRVYSNEHGRVTGLHPCDGWYGREALKTREVR